ncbi:hypothetical protein K438DRAFT_963842 [Mycena galopus ATCC 62051]|nr:hypothetical protein K438DRAFT_963842 [Mycena galopus ATCC 62051]
MYLSPTRIFARRLGICSRCVIARLTSLFFVLAVFSLPLCLANRFKILLLSVVKESGSSGSSLRAICESLNLRFPPVSNSAPKSRPSRPHPLNALICLDLESSGTSTYLFL